MFGPGRHADQAGAAAQGGFGAEQHSATGAQVAAHYQHMAEVAFVRMRVPCRQVCDSHAAEQL